MGAEPIWVTAEEVLFIHSRLAPGARLVDEALLENAVAAPINTWAYEGIDDIFLLALRLLEAVARGHAFSDGNKRAAFYAMIVLLQKNGGTFAAPDTEEVGALIEALLEKTKTTAELNERLRRYVIIPR